MSKNVRIGIRWKFILVSFITILLLIQFIYFNSKIIRVRKSFHSKYKKYKVGLRSNKFVIDKVLNNIFSFPKELQNVPVADWQIVLNVKQIPIRNIFAPYNPSIIEHANGYFLFFRYDQIQQMYYNNIFTHIGCVELNENLKQTNEEYCRIDTQSLHSEDPRILKMKDEYLLVFNDQLSTDKKKRGIHLAKLDLEEKKAASIASLDLKERPIEKNWVPFVYQAENQECSICFEYQIHNPRKILHLDALLNPNILQTHHGQLELENIPWDKKWGKPLGGTPARLIDGEYLAFFHSKFIDKAGIYWYVMGAYTFEAKPPFRITAVSPYPILFDGIYDSECLNTADPRKCVIFPGGFAIKEQKGKMQLQLACGENDSSIKIITLDKDELLNSLIKVKN